MVNTPDKAYPVAATPDAFARQMMAAQPVQGADETRAARVSATGAKIIGNVPNTIVQSVDHLNALLAKADAERAARDLETAQIIEDPKKMDERVRGIRASTETLRDKGAQVRAAQARVQDAGIEASFELPPQYQFQTVPGGNPDAFLRQAAANAIREAQTATPQPDIGDRVVGFGEESTVDLADLQMRRRYHLDPGTPQPTPQPPPMYEAPFRPTTFQKGKSIFQAVDNARFHRYVKRREYASVGLNTSMTGHIALRLPSRFAFYEFTSFLIHPLTAEDVIDLHRVRQMATNVYTTREALSTFMNILQRRCSEDLRDLSWPDFQFMLVEMLRISYYKAGYQLTWKSPFGNTTTFEFTSLNVPIDEIDMSPEELAAWQDEGFDLPRMKDVEAFAGYSMPTDDDRMLWDWAQYFIGESPDEKVAHFLAQSEANGARLLNRLSDFKDKIRHGYHRQVTLRDPKYDPQDTIAKLAKSILVTDEMIASLVKALKNISDDDEGDSQIAITLEDVHKLSEANLNQKQVLEQMREDIARGNTKSPEFIVTLPQAVGILDFFPGDI